MTTLVQLTAVPRTLELSLDLRTVSALNAREHWAVRTRRVRREREAVYVALLDHRGARAWRRGWKRTPLIVTLTRVGPRAIDFDNAISGLKGVRDELAAWLGVDDGDELVRWRYETAKGKYAVRVRMAPASEG